MKTSTSVVTAHTDNQSLTRIIELFEQCRAFEASNNIAEARKIEKKIAALVAEVAAASPNSSDHADALAYHEYTLLSLARTSKRQSVSQSLRDAAYSKGAAAVSIRLTLPKPDMGTVFAAYNLAIDLIIGEKRAAIGLSWMLTARKLLNKLAGKKKLPPNILQFKLYSMDYGIAKAYYDLGRLKEAQYTLKRALSHATVLNKSTWSELRGVSKCSELLAQIKLDQMPLNKTSS